MTIQYFLGCTKSTCSISIFKQASETEHRHVSVLAEVRKHGVACPSCYVSVHDVSTICSADAYLWLT